MRIGERLGRAMRVWSSIGRSKNSDYYVMKTPNPQNAVDIFKGEWASQFPAEAGSIDAGAIPLFEDERIHWFVESIGGVRGQSVLELGPLEGGHSYMLERAGAASIVAIEANSRAYLKCLVTKEIVQLNQTRFLCGDFMEYLQDDSCPHYDICLASGVLYHLLNPVELIRLLAQRQTKHVLLWTHYYDGEYVRKKGLRRRFPSSHSSDCGGFAHTLHRQEYGIGTRLLGFCGGGAAYSHWITRDNLIGCLQHFGYKNVRINFDHHDHPNGPAIAIAASVE